jgi:hypothetical protein
MAWVGLHDFAAALVRRPRAGDPRPRDHAYSRRQLFANAAIAASRVGS